MTEKETRELIERLRKAKGSPNLQSVLLGMHNAERTCLQAADALDDTLWKPIADMPEDRFVLLHWPYWSKYPVLGVKSGDEINSLSALSDYHIGDINGPTHYREITAPEQEKADK